MTEIYLADPNFWWRAPVDRVRHWISSDPDVEDGHRRWPDRDTLNRPLIVQAVIEVSNALAAGDWEADQDEDHYGRIAIRTTGLSKTENAVAQSWFKRSQSVRWDPWFWPLTDGRHRLWATMNEFGAELVPIAGDALGYADPENTAALGPDWPRLFARNVEQLRGVDWFATEDPVNERFTAALEQAARSEYPAPV